MMMMMMFIFVLDVRNQFEYSDGIEFERGTRVRAFHPAIAIPIVLNFPCHPNGFPSPFRFGVFHSSIKVL